MQPPKPTCPSSHSRAGTRSGRIWISLSNIWARLNLDVCPKMKPKGHPIGWAPGHHLHLPPDALLRFVPLSAQQVILFDAQIKWQVAALSRGLSILRRLFLFQHVLQGRICLLLMGPGCCRSVGGYISFSTNGPRLPRTDGSST